jgi:SAM-dependent methyltransferase
MATYPQERPGFCPVCDQPTTFIAYQEWFRGHLVCARCGSVPRERAVALAIGTTAPAWRSLRIHESSRADRATSKKLATEYRAYTATQFSPGHPFGTFVDGVRNENLEQQTFDDDTCDLVLAQDVMEHVFHPDRVCREVARTLGANGHYIFSVPTYKEQVHTRQLAFETAASVEIVGEPMYHGNPADPDGSLVTYQYGYDLAENIHRWSGLEVCVIRFHDHEIGIIGEHTEVYICQKSARSF